LDVIEKMHIYTTYLSPALFHNVQAPSETINNSSNEVVHTRPEENIRVTPVVQDQVTTTQVMTPNKLSNHDAMHGAMLLITTDIGPI
jgi:hypothetical protein